MDKIKALEAEIRMLSGDKGAQLRVRLRELAGLPRSSRLKVVFAEGDAPPARAGRPAYAHDGTGYPVINPHAYKRAGGKVVWVGSTQRVEVGIGWLAENFHIVQDAITNGGHIKSSPQSSFEKSILDRGYVLNENGTGYKKAGGTT